MRIAIVDDIEKERILLHERLERQLERRLLHAEIIEFENGETFLTAAKENPFSILFLDIYMDGMNGIETARELRSFDPDCLLIFTTTSSDHALEGFRVRAMHYLVKPYIEEDIDALTDEIIRRLPPVDKYMEIKSGSNTIKISYKNIIFAEHYGHKMHIHTTNGKPVSIRQTFGEFTEPLKDEQRFFVCNRGVIVNLEHVSDFNGTSFVMNDKTTITVSRNLTKSARQAFMDYLFQRRHFSC